tara:strand:- start:1055 stop:3121 length:2067 start_codon:yes stop_codon:yes gene_type:complete
MKNSGKLLYKSLSLIAATLPGIQGASATSTPVDKATIDTSTMHWNEGAGRYDINVYQLGIQIPLNDKLDLSLNAERDVMSGATSVMLLPENITNFGGDNSKLVEKRTGASIAEARHQLSAKTRYFFADSHVGLGVGYSTENDYRSFFFAPSYQVGFNKNNTVLDFAYSIAFDRTNPTDEVNINHLKVRPQDFGLPLSQTRRKKTQKFNFSIRQDFTKSSYGVLNIEYAYDQGFLADPYKRVLIFGDASALRPGSLYIGFFDATFDYDRRPEHRHSLAVAGRFVQYFAKPDSSLHVDYRYATNDWGLHSHTIATSYHQPLANNWEIIPKLRFYTQNAADFYAKAFHAKAGAPYKTVMLPTKQRSSSDYRLSSFGNLSADLKITKTFWDDNKIGLLIGYRLNRDSFGFNHRGHEKRKYNDYNVFYSGVSLTIRDAGFMLDETAKSRDNDIKESGYQRGTFSLKPLNFNIATLTDTYSRNSSTLNNTSYDTYRAPGRPLGFGLNDGSRQALSYGIEFGYTIVNNFELFARPSFSYEEGMKVGYATDPLVSANNRNLDFKNRLNYALSLGARKYFDIQSRFIPHIMAAFGFESQDKTKAELSTFQELSIAGPNTPLGHYTLQSRKTYKMANLEAGVDYRMSEHVSVSLTAGIHYKQKPKSATRTNLPGLVLDFKDNHKSFTYPVNVSLKITF